MEQINEEVLKEVASSTQEQVAEKLAGFAKNQKIWKVNKEEIREIGKSLNELGGFGQMIYVHNLFSEIVGHGRSYPRLLEFEWNNIGTFQA